MWEDQRRWVWRLRMAVLAAAPAAAGWALPHTALAARPTHARGQVATTSTGASNARHVELSKFYVPAVFVQRRTSGKKVAVFRAPSRSLSEDSVLLFIVESVDDRDRRVERWRCIATEDVKDCLLDRQRFRFLPEDQLIVLTAMMLPKHGTNVDDVLAGADLEKMATAR